MRGRLAPRVVWAFGVAVLALLILPGAASAAVSGRAVAAPADSIPAPPTGVQVSDTPNDVGGSITIDWTLSTDDRKPAEGEEANANSLVTGYRVFRAESPSGEFQPVGEVPSQTSEYIDDKVINGKPYYYKVETLHRDLAAPSGASGPAEAKAQWFHTGRINALIAVVILSVLIMVYIERARRGANIFIRKIAGMDSVDEAVGRATEMGKRILYIPGTGDMDNVQTLASIAILGRVARLTAEYETPLAVPVSRSLVMVAGRETVKEAYLAAGRPDDYSDGMVYYVTDDQFGYAAALEGLMIREKPATIFLQGSFYAEALILAENGNSIGAIQIAGTAEPSQLPFFVAACDYTLIGEELFMAGAYLSREPRQLGSLKGQDIGKAIILALLILGVVIETAHLFDIASWFNVQ